MLNELMILFISDNATVIGSRDVLGLSSNSIAMDTYLINFGGVVDLYLSVTSDGCLPVLESFRGELGQGYVKNDFTCFVCFNSVRRLLFL